VSRSECSLPPEGWHCFQPDGHEGPCPAYPCPWENHQHGLDWSDCWVHHRSEKITKRTYIVCFECGHVYTRFGLWRAWVRSGKIVRNFDKKYPPPYTAAVNRMTYWDSCKFWWHRWFMRPSKIFFCQECIHDF
jgi:hypothetical protein